MVDINKHKTIKMAYELCVAIEEFPASEDQTNVVIKVAELMQLISNLVGKTEGEKEHEQNKK